MRLIGKKTISFIGYLAPVLTLLVFTIVWELIIVMAKVPLYIMPPPSLVIAKFFDKFTELIPHIVFTLEETFFGFLFAIVLAIPLAALIAFSKLLKETLYPAAITLEMVPKIAFAPIIIIWFGIGNLTKVILVFLVCFFPIIINGIFGFLSLEKEYEYFIATTGASKVKAFFKIRVPAALPSIFVGLKGASINAVIGATIAEWVGGDMGLGYYIQKATGNFRISESIVAILLLTIIGLLVYAVVIIFESIILHWHESQRKKRKV